MNQGVIKAHIISDYLVNNIKMLMKMLTPRRSCSSELAAGVIGIWLSGITHSTLYEMYLALIDFTFHLSMSFTQYPLKYRVGTQSHWAHCIFFNSSLCN